MCLIVVKNKPDAAFSIESFRASQTRNSDGTGIMYVEDGRVIVEKSMGNTPKDHLDLYYKHMNKDQFILHHRMATQGEKTENNCHPFKVLSKDDGDPYDLYFAHNGQISMNKFGSDYDKKLSDTHLFALQYLQPLIKQFPEIMDNAVFQYMLHDLIGGHNKLAFLRNDGRVWIYNRSAGEEINGCWLSNKYSIENRSITHSTTYAKSHGVANSHYCPTPTNSYDGDDYDYHDGMWWRENYNRNNSIKAKQPDTLTQLNCDELMTAIDKYAGMPLATLTDLVVEDTNLAYDIINLLSEKAIPKSFMDEKADTIASKLYDLLQAYCKTLNMAA